MSGQYLQNPAFVLALGIAKMFPSFEQGYEKWKKGSPALENRIRKKHLTFAPQVNVKYNKTVLEHVVFLFKV